MAYEPYIFYFSNLKIDNIYPRMAYEAFKNPHAKKNNS